MISKYYQRELERLRLLGAEFSKAYPAIAPMIAEEGSDPDVERVLEGAAFLSGLIYEKLDDELPEIIHSLLQTLAPHYLRPIPAATLIRFSPKRSLRESLLVPRGTAINSRPVDGTECTFTTCRDVRLVPLVITGSSYTAHGKDRGTLRLDFSMGDMLVSALPPDALHFTLSGSYVDAAQRFMILHSKLESIRFVPGQGGSPATLPRTAFKPGGFAAEESLLPYPVRSFSGFRHLQEYFCLPEQFCSFSIEGVERWQNRGEGSVFSLEFLLENLPDSVPDFTAEHFQLFVTPAVNLFPMAGEPISLDHKNPSYLVRPSARNKSHYQVYSVEAVRGIRQGSTEVREYKDFLFSPPTEAGGPVYSLSPQVSPLSENVELWLSVAYSPLEDLTPEVLSLDLRCTNAELTERLTGADICMPTSTSPEMADFSGLRSPTAPVQPPLGARTLWRLLSHLYLNLLSIADEESIKGILGLYIFPKTKDRTAVTANRNRVNSIEKLVVTAEERFVRDALMRGMRLDLTVRQEGFAGVGDMYIFGSVLDVFFSAYAAVNAYTRFSLTDVLRKDEFQWPARLGSRLLL